MLNRILNMTAVFLCMLGLSSAVWADNAWGPYHWARTTTSFDLIIVDSTTSDWDYYVTQATWDWSQSTVLSMIKVEGETSKKVRRRCKPPSGQARICNLAYGQNGWLGVAGISLDSDGHIVSGYTKLNDSYLNSNYYNGYYNNPEWKLSVTCQELGHDVGLGHQDTNFNTSLDSCMDYQDPPWEYPNGHDYTQLEGIYGHTDAGSDDDGGNSGDGCNAPPGKGCNKSGVGGNNGDIGWGISLGRRGHSETFMRIDPDGIRHITHVLWVEDVGEPAAR